VLFVKIYLKTRSGKWILVSSKLEHTVVKGRKRSVKYILAGESVDPPSYSSVKSEIELPATMTTKLISALLDKKREKLVVLVEPRDSLHYVVKVVEGDPSLVSSALSELTSKSKSRPREE
jgi:hypothetical protein